MQQSYKLQGRLLRYTDRALSEHALCKTHPRVCLATAEKSDRYKTSGPNSSKKTVEIPVASANETPAGQTAMAKRRNAPAVGIEYSVENAAIGLVYFTQGVLGLARLATTYFFKDDLHLDPAAVATLTAIAGAPWVMKPLWGFLSDSLPLFGYRRKSYLFLCGVLGCASWVGMATPGIVNNAATAVGMMAVGSLSTACSDVVIDSIVVTKSRESDSQSTAGSLQSLCWGASACGGIVSAYWSGALMESFGTRGIFLLTSGFPLLLCFAALLVVEDRFASPLELGGFSRQGLGASSIRLRVKQQVLALSSALRQSGVLLPALFLFIWQATPKAETAMFYFYTNQLNFSPSFMGEIRLLGSIASLGGVGIFSFFLKEVQLRKIFFWTAIIGAVLGLSQLILITGLNRHLGLDDHLFVLGDSVVLTVLGQISFLPLLVLAARSCPGGVEASLFATLMSLSNGGSFAGSFLGSILTRMFGVTSSDFSQLGPLVAFCSLSSLLPLTLLRLVPDDLIDSDAKSED